MVKKILWLMGCFFVPFSMPAYAGGIDTAAAAVVMDREECDRLGLSLNECRRIYQEKISLEKVHEILSYGISLNEYLGRPWEQLGISEKKYLRKRRAGYSAEELRLIYGKRKKR